MLEKYIVLRRILCQNLKIITDIKYLHQWQFPGQHDCLSNEKSVVDPNTLNLELDAAPESVPILIRIYAPILIRIQAFLHSYGLCTLYTVQYIIN